MRELTPGDRRMWLVLVAMMIVPACRSPEALTVREEALVDSYLNCIECIDGELDSLRAVAVRFPAATRTRLFARLRDGPSPTQLATATTQTRQAWKVVAKYWTGHGGPPAGSLGEAAYLDVYLGNYQALVRSRAAAGLARIGGAGVRDSLTSAAGRKYLVGGQSAPRTDINDAIRFAKDSILSR